MNINDFSVSYILNNNIMFYNIIVAIGYGFKVYFIYKNLIICTE